jgi:2-keto-3-deoxy-L-fuconate dehydrogenase
MLSLRKKRVFISGAGAGIGQSISKLSAVAGARVVATDKNKDSLTVFKNQNIETMVLDVTDKDAVQAFFETQEPFDGIVNAAGWVFHGTILETTEEDWSMSFKSNVDSMFYVINSALPKILSTQNGGSIVNIASLASSLKGFKSRAAYGASKAAVIGLTKSCAVDFVADKIRFNSICPGTVETPSLHERISKLAEQFGDYKKAKNWFIDRQPMKRLGQPHEIAKLVIYLLSDDGSYATGQCHIIDGGSMG